LVCSWHCFPTDAVNGWWSGVVAIPTKPSERHAGISLAALPAVAMHHRQALAENVHATEAAAFKDCCPAFGFEERQPQQHDHRWRQLERVRDKLIGVAKGRVG